MSTILTRKHLLPAMIAALSLGVGAGMAPASGGPGASAARTPGGAPSREYVGERRRSRRMKRRAVKTTGGKWPSWDWKFNANGDALDGRGDFRRAKRLRRRALEAALGHKLSGRAWRNLRKHARHLPAFTYPTRELVELFLVEGPRNVARVTP